MEVFLFLTMGGTVDQITVLPIEPDEKNKIASSYVSKEKKMKEFAQKLFEQVDVGTSKCDTENVRQILLGVIESGFGNFDEFNRIMRQVFKNEKTSQLLSMKTQSKIKSLKLKKSSSTAPSNFKAPKIMFVVATTSNQCLFMCFRQGWKSGGLQSAAHRAMIATKCLSHIINVPKPPFNFGFGI